MIARSRAEGFGDEVKRRILIGTYVLSHGYYDAYYLQAQRLRRMIAQDFQRAYADQCDVIMGPVTPTVAKNIGDNRDDPTSDWLADVYTLGVSLAGLPAMSIPAALAARRATAPSACRSSATTSTKVASWPSPTAINKSPTGTKTPALQDA